MTPGPHDYSPITEHPKLLALYTGWLGQKVCDLTTFAVLRDRPDVWRQASAEVDRLTLVFHAAEKAKVLDLSSETGALLGATIEHYVDGGWWTSPEGTGERVTNEREQDDREQFLEDPAGSGSSPFFPRFALEQGATYTVADSVLRALDRALREGALATGHLDSCRLGALLSAFCHRLTGPLPVRFVNSVLDDLASHELVDLRAENELRRELGLFEMDGDRRPASLSTPKSFAPPVPGDVQDAGSGGRKPFDPEIDVGLKHRDLILACVFKHFGVQVPPAESDAVWHPELTSLKGQLRTASRQALRQRAAGEEGGCATGSNGRDQEHFWTEEAIKYLGLDRSSKCPEMVIQRHIKSGALRPEKIGRRNSFKKADLDRLLEKGSRARRPGRPKEDRKGR